jgi:hypothetical protein
MKENVFENPVELRTAMPAPHFEDRRVVMRAQPVVPLQEIRTKVRRRRLWFLSGAFAIAMMLGAASALVAVRVKRIAANNQIPQIAEPNVTATAETPGVTAETPVATAETSATEEDPIVDSGEQIDDSATVEEAPVQRPVAPKRHEPERPRVVTADRDPRAVPPTEDEQLEQIRDAVLYERWQERRARRVARRERRNGGDDRDLSRVDEIFEGRRRRADRPY